MKNCLGASVEILLMERGKEAGMFSFSGLQVICDEILLLIALLLPFILACVVPSLDLDYFLSLPLIIRYGTWDKTLASALKEIGPVLVIIGN